MVHLFNFEINACGALSQQCIQKNIFQYSSLCEYIQLLPYGRNLDRSDYKSVLNEQKGTCSTKHAFLAEVALEHNIKEVVLCLGIYKMKESNTKGVGAILQASNLEYLPEAHTYLKINGTIFDFTRATINHEDFKKDLLLEKMITPDQIGAYKITWHRSYLRQWLENINSPYCLKEIWEIRESCIATLTQ